MSYGELINVAEGNISLHEEVGFYFQIQGWTNLGECILLLSQTRLTQHSELIIDQ